MDSTGNGKPDRQPPRRSRRGFLLQVGYRVESDRPVVQLRGTLESGHSFLIRDTRQRPRFHILESDAAAAVRLGATVRPEEPRRLTMGGRPVSRVETRLPADVPPLRRRLLEAGIPCFEADVRFAYRNLIDLGIRGSLSIDGPPRRSRNGPRIFTDPRIGPADWRPRLSVLSLDIETDPAGRRLLSVALATDGVGEVLLWTPPGTGCPDGAVGFPTQRALLEGLARRVRALDPDLLTGWNVIDFDLACLDRLARRLDIPLRLGRGGEPARLTPTDGAGPTRHRVQIAGRVVLDGIDLLRGAFVRVERYGLDAVARQFLGRGKTIVGRDRAREILEAFQNDRPRLVAYNLNDARLVLEILERLDLVELTVERCLLTGMPPDRVSASIASFDFLYLGELVRRGRVAPTVDPEAAPLADTQGGTVLDPRPGLYRNVLVLDFRSLYPSLIRTFQIDPLGHCQAVADPDPIVAPNGAAFRRAPGILPGLLDQLFPRRDAARAAGNDVASQAIKILMNSFYGVLGTSACRFASPALANAITGFGKEILLWTRAEIESLGHEVLYGDTDSLFVVAAAERADEAERIGRELAATINRALARHVAERWRVESRLALEFERLYLRLLLPTLRGGSGGARKRYAGLVRRGDETAVVFTGMESVRRDWTRLAKQVQLELYTRLFSDRGVESYLRRIVAELRDGRHDELLVYRKALRKPIDSYVASTPPHVAAARKLGGRRRGTIEYVITVDGPEPTSLRRAAIDHEHYVQKQIRPVAEPVLAALDLHFDRVVGDDRQMELF